VNLSDQRRDEILEATTAFYHAGLLKFPRILTYLRERRLSEEIMIQARLGYASGGLREHLLALGFGLEECQAAAVVRADGKDFFFRKIVIPYVSHGKVVLLRARTDPEEPDKAYFPLPGYPVRLYGEDLLAAAAQVVITEGEFDCLVLRQWGFDAVAIPGAGAFKPEWVKLFGHCRRIYLGLDMDEAGRRATSGIAPYFGERALVVSLPQGKDVTEYVCLGGASKDYEELLAKAKSWISLELEHLPQLPDPARAESAERLIALLPELSSAARVVYQDQLCKGLGWSKQTFNAVSKEVQTKKAAGEAKDQSRVGALAILERESRVNRLHPAQDFIDGVLWYGVPAGEQLLFLTSGRKLLKFGELPEHLRAVGTGYSLRRISNEAVKHYLDGGSVPGHLLIEKLSRFLRRFVFFRDERMSVLVAVWMMGTYTHVLFQYYGYLLLHSPAKRCGKSLLEGILSKLAFNATPIFTHPTTAQLYRGPARDRGTQILDEVDRLRGNKELFGALLAVLNVGFQRGSAVLRYDRVGENFEERSFEAYVPRVLAGIATTTMPDVLEDRSILVSMHRKRPAERVERFNVRRLDAEIQGLRDDLYLWALGHAEALAQLYDQMEEVPALSAVDDRLRTSGSRWWRSVP